MQLLQKWRRDYLKTFSNCARKVSRLRNGGLKVLASSFDGGAASSNVV